MRPEILELSNVYKRIYYLVKLRELTVEVRLFFLKKYISPDTLNCIGEIARKIYNENIPILERDIIFFDDMDLVMRFLFSDKISFRRKKAMLIHNHTIINRLLRNFYIHGTIQDQISSHRES